MKKIGRVVLLTVFVGLPVLLLSGVLFINVFNWNLARSSLASLSRSFTPYEVNVKGDWKMRLGRNFELGLEDFSIVAEDYPADAPPLFKANRFFVRIATGAVFKPRKVIEAVELEAARAHLLRNEEGKLVFLPPEREEKEEDAGPTTLPELNNIDVRDVALVYDDRSLKETASLSIDRIRSLAGQGIEPIHINGKGRLEGENFSLAATWEDKSGKNQGPFDLAMLVEMGKNRLIGDGEVVMAEDDGGLHHAKVNLQADITDPGKILRVAGIPSRKPDSFTARVQLAADGEELKMKGFRWQTARSLVAGHATTGTKERRPYVDAIVTVERLDYRDIEGFLPPERGEEGGKPQGAPIFSRDPINVDALEGIDAKVAFVVKKFRADNALGVLQGVKGSANLNHGNLKVTLDDVRIGGGQMIVHAALDTTEKNVTADAVGEFRDVSLTAAAKPFEEQLKEVGTVASSLLGGNLSGDFKFKTQGKSVHTLASNLDGVMSLALEDGQLNSALLSLLNLEMGDALEAWFKKQTGARVPCVLARFPIKDGVIRSEGMYADTEMGEMLGDGYIDLGKEAYDIRFASKSDKPVESDVKFPLHFRGHFNGEPLAKDHGKDTQDEKIKEALPHAQQQSVAVQQTEETKGCMKELRERYLPAKKSILSH